MIKQMQEYLDIVDENDQVIGRDTRANVHAAQAYHRSVHIVLFNASGKVFVQLRSKHKDVGAGLWDTSAAGHVESGESYEQCAVRELHEELGIDVASSELEAGSKLYPHARNGFEFARIYSVCSEQPLVLQVEEIDDGRWVTPEALDDWIEQYPEHFTDVFKLVWTSIKDASQGRQEAHIV